MAEASVAATERCRRRDLGGVRPPVPRRLLRLAGRLAAGTRELERAGGCSGVAAGPGAVGARAGGRDVVAARAGGVLRRPADDAARLLARARGVVPAEDGYTRCLVAATAAMADQLADRPATVREAVEPVWSLAMDLGSDFWFGWAQALLGWAVAADDAAPGLAMMAETVDEQHDPPDQAVLPDLLGARLCEHGRTARASPASTRASPWPR